MRIEHARQEADPGVLGKIRLIEKNDAAYPPQFGHYERMPQAFYVLGNLPDPSKPAVAIVGSRACSPYGRDEARRFGRELARAGVQIVSGMALGVDAWSEEGALEGGGRTFAVLGTGVDVCYPEQNYGLYRRIIREGGGIISEFPPGSPPNAWHFPIRNRLISALSDAVLVVEARLRSGSLITADYAMEQGKSIFAVPGRNGDPLSQGCNRLIAQGAGIAWTPEIILEELGIISECRMDFESSGPGVSDGRAGRLRLSGQNRSGAAGSPDGGTGANDSGREQRRRKAAAESIDRAEKKIRKLPKKWAHSDDFQKVFRCLGRTPVSLDSLQKNSGLDMPHLTSVLMQLCISGYAREEMPGFYDRL